MKSRIFVILTSTLAMAVFALGSSPVAVSADNPLPLPVTHQHFNGVQGPITQEGDGVMPSSGPRRSSGAICTTPSSSAANVNTDCEGNAPHNETSIAVNPTNSLNRIGSVNDYQLTLSSGGTTFETVYSRAHVTSMAARPGPPIPLITAATPPRATRRSRSMPPALPTLPPSASCGARAMAAA